MSSRLFNDALSISLALFRRKKDDYDWKISKETVVKYFNVPYQQYSGGTGENNDSWSD